MWGSFIPYNQSMKPARLVLIGLLIILLGAGGYLAWSFFRQVNPIPLVGSGGATNVELPPGFESEVFASGLDAPRFIAFGPNGTLHVAERGANRIVALPDNNGDGQADETIVVAAELNRPHSLVFHEGDWYIGVPSGVVRLSDADGDGVAETRETVVGDLPDGGAHTTRTVEFLPDGRMAVSVGSSCNVCTEDDPRRAAIIMYDDATGANPRIFAEGLRNAVGVEVHPETGELWVTNNGRDLMGDDLPPETVYIVEEGVDYGFPRCHAGDIPDPEFGGENACVGVPEPLVEMQAHMAPLGLTFYDAKAFPETYQGDLFIAMHGSWNRSVPVGYNVMRVPLDGSKPTGPAEPFATGWLSQETGESSGRPVGLAVGPDGALYVSDDKGGFIYRIWYAGGS